MNEFNQIMRRPLTLIAAAYAAGIWCALYCGITDWRRICAGALIATAGWGVSKYFHRITPARCCLIMAWFFAGWAALGARLDDSAAGHLSGLTRAARETLELRGRVAGNPVLMPGVANRPGVWMFELAVSELRRLPSWQSAHGHVSVRLPETEGLRPQYGGIWEFSGVLTDNLRLNMRRRQWTWEIGFDAGKFIPSAPVAGAPAVSPAWRLDRRYDFRADAAAARRIESDSADLTGRVLNPVFAARERAGESLRRGLDRHPDVAAVLRALTLGYRAELPPEARRRFVATGAAHLFAISGLHMALLALFIAGVLRVVGVSSLYWFFWVAPMLAAFTVAVGAPASAVRGGLMAAIWFLGPAAGRRNDGISALAAAGLLILLVSPAQLFAPGFLLSFMVVAGLICGVPVFHKMPSASAGLDDPAGGRTWPRRCAVGLWRQMRFYLVVAIVAWLASMPLIARWFNIWSPLTPLANLPVIPLASFMLGCAFAAVIAGIVHPAPAAFFNTINILPTAILQAWLAFVQSLPFCQFFVKAPPVWTIVCWYAGLALVCLPRLAGATHPFGVNCGANETPAAGRGAVWARRCLAAVLLLAWPAWNACDNRAGRAQVLNADGVAVALGRVPEANAAWMVNAGGRRHARMTAGILARAGLDRLDVWLFTGMSARHAGGAEALMDMAVRPVRLVAHPADVARYRIFGGFCDRMRSLDTAVCAANLAEQGETVSDTYWRVWPMRTATVMIAAIAMKDWRLEIVPSASAGADELRVCHALAHVFGDALKHDAGTITAAAPALLIRCATHSFGDGFIEIDGMTGINLAPGRLLTLDFVRHGFHLRWTDDQP